MGKIYTKTGDTGMTSLIGGKRVPKSNVLVEIYGSIDELASFVGVLYDVSDSIDGEREILIVIQKALLRIEAFYASEMSVQFDVNIEDIDLLESYINKYDSSKPLGCFVIPGGSISSSLAHVCRTVCRRCERWASHIDNSSYSLKYLNRLSDFFFIIACKKQSNTHK